MLKITRDGDIRIPRGDSGYFDVIRTQEDEKVPFETGDILTMTVRKNAWSPEILLQKEVTVFPDGIAHFALAPEETSVLPFGIYRFDVQFVSASGDVDTLVGPAHFMVGEEITHAAELL